MSRSWYITGTDTGAGKTFFTAGLLRAFTANGLSVAGMKPVAAGVGADGRNEDVVALCAASSPSLSEILLNPYTFQAPTAPDFAALREHRYVEWPVLNAAYLALCAAAQLVLVEGVGGWCVPLNRGANLWQADLARRWNLPVLLVVGIKLGAINHGLLTAGAILRDGCSLGGWVANMLDPDYEFAAETVQLLKDEIKAPCLGELRWSTGLPDNGRDQQLTAIAARLNDRKLPKPTP